MPLTNAERQKRHREKIRVALTTVPIAAAQPPVVDHLEWFRRTAESQLRYYDAPPMAKHHVAETIAGLDRVDIDRVLKMAVTRWLDQQVDRARRRKNRPNLPGY